MRASVLRRISSYAAGRRSKWLVIGAWVVLGLALGPLQPKLQDSTTNENEAFLPGSADSTRVNDLIEERFPEGREVDAIVVYNRERGLSPADVARIDRDARALCQPGAVGQLIAVIDPFSGPVCGESEVASGGGAAKAGALASLTSGDGTTALLIVSAGTEESEGIQENVKAIRGVVPSADAPPGELRAYVSGTAGIISDSIDVFETIDVSLLVVTVSLVLVLLLIIYRSPVIALVPLFVVAIAYAIAAAATYGLIEAGWIEVNGQTTSLLIVLMFGAGTDYCLLIVARFKEELRTTSDKHEAMAHATERTAPAILSAGGTVFTAMLVLLLADFKATQNMGPVLALGIAIMVLAGLTLLPALLAALGRRAFWPAVPRLGTEERRPLGVWRRIGHIVRDRPVVAMVASILVLGAGALGNLEERGILDFGEGFRDDPESVEGQALITEKLSAGQVAPTNVLAAREAAGPVTGAVRSLPEADAVRPAGTSEDGELARIDVTLSADPFSDEASEAIPEIRAAADSASGDSLALVGGLTAENHDTTEALKADAQLIVPLILGVIFLILCVLVRALVAPLYLVATVVLSYGFAIGTSTLIFTQILGQPDSDPSLPTFAFIFLVALGVDYNIFLIGRIREESEREDTSDAVITGLERTGGVITSAGLILVGTFMALTTLPLEALVQIGFTIALGLLVDTFLVRTVLVPAIAFQLGDRNWWPSLPRRRKPAPAKAS